MYKLVGFEIRIQTRRISRQAVEISKLDRADSFRALNANRCIQCSQRDAHVGRGRCNTLGATAQDGVNSVEPLNGPAPTARHALVALRETRAVVGQRAETNPAIAQL